MTDSAEERRDREILEEIMIGMTRGELPEVHCRVCGSPIRYAGVFRDDERVISLRTVCPCGHSSGAIRGI
ncbi:hypothetical protein ACWGR4_30245 [Embleya sp. NPDC055664]